MTHLARALALSLFVTILGACGAPEAPAPAPADDFESVLPDADALSIDLDVGQAGELTTPADAGGPAEGHPSMDLDARITARGSFAPVNESARHVAALIESLRDEPAQVIAEDERAYGPADRCMAGEKTCLSGDGFAAVRLFVHRDRGDAAAPRDARHAGPAFEAERRRASATPACGAGSWRTEGRPVDGPRRRNDMRTTMTLGAGLIALALSACGKIEESDPYLDGIPDAAGLALEIQGGANEGLALTFEPAAAAVAAGTATPVTGDDLAEARAKIRALNEAIRAVFARVADVAASGGEELPGDVKIYGPADRCVEPGTGGACLASANLRLAVRRHTPRIFSFALEARPVGSTLEADFHPVLAGYLVRGAAVRRGAGKLWVNLENLGAAAGPGFKGQGYMAAGFASGPVARAATYAMVGFTRDPDTHPAVTAAFSGYRTALGTTRVRVAGLKDLDTAGTDLELGLGRIVYNPALGGRAYAVVANWLDRSTVPPTPRGDVPAGQYWFGRACYAPGQTTPAFKEWFLCPAGQGPFACLEAQGGWVSAVGTQVAGDPGDTWQNTCALGVEPPEFAPPLAPPADDPSDGSTEEGQDETDLSPDPVPADPLDPDLTPPQG